MTLSIESIKNNLFFKQIPNYIKCLFYFKNNYNSFELISLILRNKINVYGVYHDC